MKIVHRAGRLNGNADAISRIPYPQSDSISVNSCKPDESEAPVKSNNHEQNQEEYTEVVLEIGNEFIGSIDPADKIPSTDMATLQRECPDFDFIIKFLETREMPDDVKKQNTCIRAEDQYVLDDNILYHLYQPRAKVKVDAPEKYIWQLALPRVKRDELIHNYHDSIAGGGHFGVRRTFEKVRQKYWWPQMHQQIKDHVLSCDTCQRVNVDRHHKQPPLQPLPVEDTFSRVHIDILGPLPKTKDGYQFVLLIMDSFTKWSEAFPLVSTEAKEIATILFKEYIARYGAPRVLVSDRGRNFMSKLVNALCELFRIRHHYTSSYHPQTNSTCERTNSTLAKLLRAYIDGNQTNWANLLPYAMMAFRATPSTESTGYSPFELVFGKQMTLPVDITLIPKPNLPKQTEEFLHELFENLRTIKLRAKGNQEAAAEKAKLRHDIKAKEPSFKVTDKVLKKNHVVKTGLSSKLTHKYLGPYEIVQLGPGNTYKLKNCQTGKVDKSLTNASNIMFYSERPKEPSVETDKQNQSDVLSTPPSRSETVVDLPTPPSRSDTITNDQPQVIDQSKPNKSVPQTVDRAPNKHNVGKIVKILKTCINCRRRIFYVEFDNGSKKWENESNVDKTLIDEYYNTHTKLGRKRKKHKNIVFQSRKSN